MPGGKHLPARVEPKSPLGNGLGKWTTWVVFDLAKKPDILVGVL